MLALKLFTKQLKRAGGLVLSAWLGLFCAISPLYAQEQFPWRNWYELLEAFSHSHNADGSLKAFGGTGPQGEIGPVGPQGEQGPAGASFQWRGTWSAVTAYVENDVVELEGSTYIALQASTNENPETGQPDNEFWDLFTIAGIQGPQGEAGPQGAVGPAGPGTTGVRTDVAYLKSIATNALTGGHGVTGNGTTNDTAAISSAISVAIASSSNVWNGYHVIYFPAGTYVVNNLSKTGASFSNLYIIGDSGATIFKRGAFGSNNIGIFEITGSSHIRISDIAIDQNGLTSFGGWKFYACTDVIIERTHFFDSVNSGGVLNDNASDLYAWLFAAGNSSSKDIIIRDNIVEDLQIEVDRAERVLIERNISLRSPTTCAIGAFALGASMNFHDYTVRDNVIIDPWAEHAAIVFRLDDESASSTSWKRIKIYNNKIYMSVRAARAMQIGAGSAGTTTGGTFEDIYVQGNYIEYAHNAAAVASHDAIHFNNGPSTGFTFQRVHINHNTIKSQQVLSGNYGMNLLYMANSRVIDNNVMHNFGIRMRGLATTRVLRNHVGVYLNGTAYDFATSLGNNTLDNNYYRGSPSTIISSTPGTGDSIETPTSAQLPFGLKAKNVTYNPGTIEDGTEVTTNITFVEASLGITTVTGVSFSQDLQGVDLKAQALAGEVEVTFRNNTGAQVVFTEGTLRIRLDHAL